MAEPRDVPPALSALGSQIHDAYAQNRRILSFPEYFALALEDPARHARSAAQLVRDVFDHYGTRAVRHPRGEVTRYRLFDAPWAAGKGALIGQEDVQARVYRALSNFVRDGRVSRLLLLHGPNGSAKSTFAACVENALADYSRADAGALYRFNWVFPATKTGAGGIGFGQSGDVASRSDTYAYLADRQLDARLTDELRDHPLLLVPAPRRRALLEEALAARGAKDFVLCEYLARGELSPKNRQIYEALLANYRGDYLKVLRHVQVERFYVEPRYREAVVTVEPQMHVDARARQVSMDRSLGALPAVLQSSSLFEYGGDLVDANRGIIEYSDLLKRPLEAYKYLLGTVEDGSVALESAILPLDLVFIGSSNEAHLSAFKEIPDFQSFKGRMELVRVPYILDYTEEQRIYDERVRAPALGKHVAPHVTYAAALWAVLTRMRKPVGDKYPKGLAELVGKLSPLDKAELYARGVAPDGFTSENARELVAHLPQLWSESDAYPNYEGRTGASPREILTALLNAAASGQFACLSVAALLEELEELCKATSVHEFLKQEPLPGGFHEPRKFIAQVRERVLDLYDEDFRSSMGLVDEQEYARVFERYALHVTHWIRKEKVRNPVTGRLEEPDEELMSGVEKTLGVSGRREDHRAEIMSRIGAWSIDHPGQKLDLAQVFAKPFATLREHTFEQAMKAVRKTNADLLVLLTDGADKLADKESRSRAEATLERLKGRGYCALCARETAGLLARHRYAR